MKRAIVASVLVAAFCVAATGCTYVNSARGGSTAMANDAWFTETTGLGPLLPFSWRVYYCPPMGADGPSACMEAEMIDEASAAVAAPAPAPAPEQAPPTQDPPPSDMDDPMADDSEMPAE